MTKDLGAHIAAVLAENGFRKRAGLIFTVELADDILGQVGLPTATQYTRKGEIKVNPVVGLRHQLIERVVARLCGEKFHPYIPATISTPLGYLMPQDSYLASDWLFGPDEDFTAAADQMVDAIRTYGMPFLYENATLDKLTKRIGSERRERSPESYRLPVAYLLTGKYAQAAEALTRDLRSLGDRRDPAATRYRQFAEQFRTQLLPQTSK
jgi:hypothetical protein